MTISAAERRERRRDYDLRRRYGITAEQYDAMLAAQGGRCALCGRKPGRARLALDHDHRNGAVRSLLCSTCNREVVGNLDRHPELLPRAIEFLTRLSCTLALSASTVQHTEDTQEVCHDPA